MKKKIKGLILIVVIIFIIYAVSRPKSTTTKAADAADKVQETAKANNIPPNDPAVLTVASKEAAKEVVTPSMVKCNALKRGDLLYLGQNMTVYLDKSVALSENKTGVLDLRAIKDKPSDFCSLKAGDPVYVGCKYVYPSGEAAIAQCNVNILKCKWDPRVVS